MSNGSGWRLKQGFSIIDVLIIIVIIAILAMVVLPLLPNMTDTSKQSSTIANLRSIASAMSIYHVDFNRYPVASDIITLKAVLQPTYMKTVPTKDGWGQPFFVDAKANTYKIGSGGKGWDGVDSLTSNPMGATVSYDSDIIVEDGEFTQFPAGTQSE